MSGGSKEIQFRDAADLVQQFVWLTNSQALGSGRGSISNSMFITQGGQVGVGTLYPENDDHWTRAFDIFGSTDSKIITTTDVIQTGIWSHNFAFLVHLAVVWPALTPTILIH